MTPPPIYDLVSIGAGPAVTPLIRAGLAEGDNRALRSPPSIALVEPRMRPGVGSPWDEPHPHLITNMQGHTLKYYGALTSAGHFEFQTPRDLVPAEERLHHIGQPYIERAKIGHRLHQLFEETLACAGMHNVRIDHIQATAVRVHRTGRDFTITLGDGRTIRARCVVLAMGLLSADRYPQLAGLPGYHAEGWNPGTFLSRIDVNSRVAILGAGPTAIDWFLRLCALDLRSPIVMASPSGRLPAVRPLVRDSAAPSAFSSDYLRDKSQGTPFTGREVELIIRAILAEVGTTPAEIDLRKALALSGGRALFEATLAMSEEYQPFFEGLKRIDDVTTTLWCLSSEEARARIVSKWAPLHAALSFAIPPVTALAMRAALNTARLDVHGSLSDVTFSNGAFRLSLAGEGQAVRTIDCDFVINATGFQADLAQCTSILVRNLLADRLVVKGRYGGIAMEYDTGQVLDGDDRPVKGLYALGGTLSRSAAYSINSLLGTTQHAVLVGRACARYLQLRDFSEHQRSPAPPADVPNRLRDQARPAK